MRMAMSFVCLALTWAGCPSLFAQGVGAELRPIAFSTLDMNKDGKLSLREARADPDLYMAFEMLDRNHDGYLTPLEFQAWPRALKNKDAAPRDPATAPSGSAGAQHMPPN
jgi:EF-hand domain/EF hand